MRDRSGRAELQQRFGELLENHRGIVLKVARMYTRLEEDRQDLIQEIMLQLWRSFPRYDDRRSFSTWTYRIALNVAISAARKSQRDARSLHLADADEIERSPAMDGGHGDIHLLALRQMIDELDSLNRALLLLYLDDYTYGEIASILGISETNVATKLGRLKQRLREQHAPQEPIQTEN